MATGYVVKIIRCRNIPAKDIDGSSDPYVKLKLGQQPKQKTKIVKKSLNPEFNQEFRYTTWGSSEKLVASVWDWNRLAAKVFIGQVVFPHPEHGVVSGAFPLVDQKGGTVGGTIEVSITSEYLLGVERRASTERRRDSGDRRLNTSGHSARSPESDMDIKRATTPTPGHAISPSSTSDPPVFLDTLDGSQKALSFTPVQTENVSFSTGSLRERERDVEREREKEREKERERDRKREKEREEDRKRIEDMLERSAQLQSEFKKQSAIVESLEKELTEIRQTVTSLEAWSNEGKAHAGTNAGSCSWFVRLFPCCFTSTKRAASKKEIVKLEETEMSNDPVHRTNGSV